MKRAQQERTSVVAATRRARRRVYIEVEEHVARALSQGATRTGESESAYLCRVLANHVPSDGPEFESTRRIFERGTP